MGKLHIKMTNPCKIDWTKMTEADDGRYCNTCEKIVVNFADMSDNELLEFFQNPEKRASNCGRFTEKQLTEGILFSQVKNKLQPLKKLAAATLIGLSMAGTPILVNGQTIIEIEEPPVYDTIHKKVLVTPAHLKQVDVPAEYVTVESKRLIWQGGYAEFREMSCMQAIPHDAPIPVEKVQQKLKELGFYQGAIDNVMGPKTKAAVIAYGKANGLGDEFSITPYVLDMMGVTAMKE